MPFNHLRIAAMAGMTLALAAPSGHAQMHKCRDEKGRITYSDQGCAVRPEPPAQAAKAAPAAVKPATGKLTDASVAAVVKHASELAAVSDYRGQCALAAPDLKFTITDQSTTPPTIVSGGRGEICALQRASAQAIDANQLKPAIKLGKQAISMNLEATRATATYETFTTLSHQGQVVIQQRCSRQDVFGVYGDQILYAAVTATCKPS